MKPFVKRMIEEHAQLVIRIEKLHNYVYGEQAINDDKVEYANKCIQLKAMRVYVEALDARLLNQGIEYNPETKQYTEVVGFIADEIKKVYSDDSECDSNCDSKCDSKTSN